MANKKETTALVKVDVIAGSRSFNRFELQLSQTLHMAIIIEVQAKNNVLS